MLKSTNVFECLRNIGLTHGACVVPAMVTRGDDRELLMSYGVMGGFMQPRKWFLQRILVSC